MQTVNQTSTPTKAPAHRPTVSTKFGTALVLSTLALAHAHAADSIDVSGATSLFDQGKVAAAAIGVAALVFAIGIVIYKRIRGAA